VATLICLFASLNYNPLFLKKIILAPYILFNVVAAVGPAYTAVAISYDRQKFGPWWFIGLVTSLCLGSLCVVVASGGLEL